MYRRHNADVPLLDRLTPEPDAIPARLTAFGLLYCSLHVGTVFLGDRFAPGLSAGDWISLSIPWAVLGSAALLWDALPLDSDRAPVQRRLLLAAALAYATGFGINLAANSIGRLIPAAAPTPASVLAYFLDEHLGHILWHAGMAGMTAAILLAPARLPRGRLTAWPVLGATAYAFAYFTDAVEGQTVVLLLPFSVLVFGFLACGPYRRRRSIVDRFFLLAHALALLFFGVWAGWQHGFPQFSELGML
jgi:hypothetical protein